MARRIVHVDGIVPITRDYPIAVVSNGLVFIGGLRGGRTDGVARFADLPADFRRNGFSGLALSDQLEGEFAADAWTTHENLDRVLRAAGSDPLQVLRLHIWLRDKRLFPVYERIRMAWQKVPAPSSCLGVRDVIGRFGRSSGIEAFAVVPGENPLFPERVTVAAFDNQGFPAAAFYSQAVRCGPLVTLAGHIPIATNKAGKPLIGGYDDVTEEGRFLATGRSHTDSRQGPIAAQSFFVYQAIRDTLAAQGLHMQSIKHVAVMLQDIRDFGTFHRVHQRFFPEEGPALIVAGFNEVGHKGTLIEIEPLAVVDSAEFPTAPVAWPIPAPIAGPAAMTIGPLCFLAGMLGLDANGRLLRTPDDLDDAIGRRVASDLARFETSPGFAAQCWAAWMLISKVCAQAGLRLAQLVKLTVYLRNRSDLWIFEEIRAAFTPTGELPAAEFIAVQAPGPVPDAHVQIEAVASTD
jgi:enamine deaminase RidA (YjgF/YER057c/UK114 family)